ncbi:hydantoinase/oxoprolinase family protein [Mesorhizobium retamae]|uniref:Hydantoinase/oxoprolinase family protein n=1 Tax=Mesorhizobium retamae TaxID=2912854 RepID=A0ABS9QD54_9HYPH|nr:hydantoinase/oxoprolinase family protein [Mesorhizobium sp. IRAMC:0171]MCG7505345.1 hydantoinase/oxoprolinase family protein [Mesorhizobium sp. IRAMC:0171]
MPKKLRIGVDVGGTFTDFVLLNEETGEVHFWKSLTDYSDIADAIVKGMEALTGKHGFRLEDVAHVAHATTLVTNAIIERRGARVGLITTRGFRDTLEIGREARYDIYDLFLERPDPLVPRELRCEVHERIDAKGTVVHRLREEDVTAALDLFERRSVEAIAVAFMHSYLNTDHERHVRRLIHDRMPGIPVSLSSDVAPEIREYERTNTACANAYVQPIVRTYLSSLGERLRKVGFSGSLQLMFSEGGMTTARIACDEPIKLIESGPAAGAMASVYFANVANVRDVISFDMGGTTAKMCLLENGEPRRSNEFEAARAKRFKKGSGLPLKLPVIDLIEIGAGGGSIAHLNAMGLPKVGPVSAGSKPGPACYGLGGTKPTVTDANLVLGYLSPKNSLGGKVQLDLGKAANAIRDVIADALETTTVEGAAGIHDIVNEAMASATRMYLTENGKDPSKQSLLAFGGAGPSHAFGIARRLGIDRIIIPPGAGVMSALGMLVSSPTTTVSRSHMSRLSLIDWAELTAMFREMEDAGRALLIDAGTADGDIIFERSADLRFAGQGFEVCAPVPLGTFDAGSRQAIEDSFIQAYEALFGRRIEGVEIEATTWRLRAKSAPRDLNLRFPVATMNGSPQKGSRKVWFSESGYVDCKILDRLFMPPGFECLGPAIVEETETTIVAGPGSRLSVDPSLNVIIDLGPGTH